jgi:hypothetical protein
LLNLSAQRRLGDVQQFGGAGEVEVLSQHLKIPQVTQFHEASAKQFAYLKGMKSDQFYIGFPKKAVPESVPEL